VGVSPQMLIGARLRTQERERWALLTPLYCLYTFQSNVLAYLHTT